MAVNCRVLKNGVCEITQYFNENHIGIDVVGQNYTLDTVVAHTNGTVVLTQTGRGNNQGSTGNESYGNFIKIDHGNGWFTLYAHLDTVNVNVGDNVLKGDILGNMGNTGNSYGAHLHFEVWKNNTRIDPYEYLDKNLFETVTQPVLRDESKNQLKVNVDDLRIRNNSSTSSEILGIATLNGIYNYYDKIENEGYTWYKIADNEWVANLDNWITLYPINNTETPIDEITLLKEENKNLKNEISLLKQENERLNQNIQDFKEFKAPNAGIYYIRLSKDEILTYKRN